MTLKPFDVSGVLRELHGIYEKYGLPKGMGFVPDRLEITLRRQEGERFDVTYSEFFSYLPSDVFNAARENVTQLFQEIGVLPEAIDQLENGVKVHLNGDFRVALFLMVEILLQKRHIESELQHYLDLADRYIQMFSSLYSFHWEFDEETEKEWRNYMSLLEKTVRENPSISAEIKEILNKYAARPK